MPAEKDALLQQQVLRVTQLEQLLAEKDGLLGQQGLRVTELEQHVSECKARLVEPERALQAIYDSRSWKMTAPLRTIMAWLRR
jgi:hypothetical protein